MMVYGSLANFKDSAGEDRFFARFYTRQDYAHLADRQTVNPETADYFRSFLVKFLLSLPMPSLPRRSLAEQTAEHLREGIRDGRWSGNLPGVPRLASELDVSAPSIRAALRQLEAEGLLETRGVCRSRSITPQGAGQRALRVGILLYDLLRDESSQNAQVLLQIHGGLEKAGHQVFFSDKSLVQLQHEVPRIVRYVSSQPADAWIVVGGSKEVLRWFAGQPLPCLALYGRVGDLALAYTGPDLLPACLAATRQLLALGHRRIVFITRCTRRTSGPGRVERAFLEELAAHEILTGEYHLPDWKETPAGFVHLLSSLFQHTPPTALIVDETPLFIAAMEFLARNRMHVPEQVSLVSTENDASMAWCHPGIAYMHWDVAPVVRRIMRWAASVRTGKRDHRHLLYPAKFVPGGSIGPAWEG
jgi:DNA-binding LacI/PurR family transcriptional regulator